MLAYCEEYLNALMSSDGQAVVHTIFKTGFLGTLVNIISLKEIYFRFVIQTPLLTIIFTYKLSQDHLEMFFGLIRKRGGLNDNPTSQPFEAAYKRLLLHSELTSSTHANCLKQDDTSILYIKKSTVMQLNFMLQLKTVEDEDFEQYQCDLQIVVHKELSKYVLDVNFYNSGAVVQSLKKNQL